MAITRRHLLVAAAAGGGMSANLLNQAGVPFNPGGRPGIRLASDDISGLGGADDDDLARLQMADPPMKLPPLTFQTENGAALTLRDVLGANSRTGAVINFWATWCGPCRQELPSLDALAGILQARHIPVLALASDLAGAAAVQPFFAAHDIKHLAVLLDPGMIAAHQIGARGVPTTLLVDSRGCECARLEGAADWADPRLIARIEQLIGGTLGSSTGIDRS